MITSQVRAGFCQLCVDSIAKKTAARPALFCRLPFDPFEKWHTSGGSRTGYSQISAGTNFNGGDADI